ncbi:MAG: nickel pincer cofactor biosynthesis protein LarB [Actinobacteria bacterium]|nr:nickel pincer cofactor biosynthesis protein LarB [Actinomycetota bacterium]
MNSEALLSLLRSVAEGTDSVDSAYRKLSAPLFVDQHDAKVDHHRALRCGFPEVILCQGKTPEQVRSIGKELLTREDVLLATRANVAQYQALSQVVPDARYIETAGLIVVDRRKEPRSVGQVLIATGGTADVPVAEEAAITAELMGARVTRLYDVGVAGVHRLLAHADLLLDARVIVAVAGMEGALPSVVGGLVSCPVIAVPTSVGYGAHFGGLAPLLTMLNSCASGVGVVNIDNGFGAGTLAARINALTTPEVHEPASGHAG